MMPRAIRWETWELRAEADRRFRRIALGVGLPILILAILVPLWNFGDETKGGGEFDGAQYVQLLPEKAELAPQVEEPKPAEKDNKEAPKQAAPVKAPSKVVVKPTPEIKPVETAREKAQKVFSNSGFDQLADLRDQNLSAITTQQPLTSGTITSKGGIGGAASSAGSADAVAASAAAASGGIGGNGTASVTTTQSGSGLGTRKTTTVKSPLGFGTDKSKAGQNGEKIAAGRTLTEIKLTFDKNAGPFYAIFNRAARENADIGRGTIRVNLTISPSGSVTSCTLVSSTYNEPDFERKVIERVKLVNFGAKDVPTFTTDYPIYFIPQ